MTEWFLVFWWTVWNGKCPGNSVWTSIWGWAIPQARDLYLWGHHVSHSSGNSNLNSMGFHGQTSNPCRPRPPDISRSWQIFSLAHFCHFPLCNSPVPGALFADAELDCSNAAKLGVVFVLPYSRLLGVIVQVGFGKCRTSPGNRVVLLVQCDSSCCVCEVFFGLWEVSGVLVERFVCSCWGILPLGCPLCEHGLVTPKEIFVFQILTRGFVDLALGLMCLEHDWLQPWMVDFWNCHLAWWSLAKSSSWDLCALHMVLYFFNPL